MLKFQLEPTMQWNKAVAVAPQIQVCLDGHCLFEIHLQELAAQNSTCKAACSLPTIDFWYCFWSGSIGGIICNLMSAVSNGRVLRYIHLGCNRTEHWIFVDLHFNLIIEIGIWMLRVLIKGSTKGLVNSMWGEMGSYWVLGLNGLYDIWKLLLYVTNWKIL